jgi:hypothetical protein
MTSNQNEAQFAVQIYVIGDECSYNLIAKNEKAVEKMKKLIKDKDWKAVTTLDGEWEIFKRMYGENCVAAVFTTKAAKFLDALPSGFSVLTYQEGGNTREDDNAPRGNIQTL